MPRAQVEPRRAPDEAGPDQFDPTTGDLSIVVVSWNTRDLLERCLRSLEADLRPDRGVASSSPGRAAEVIVVDNNSADGTVDMVRDRFPWVRLIAADENLGFARANNLALRAGRGRYALLLNPDTEVRPGALNTLVSYLDRHPNVGAVGPRILNPDGSLQESCYPSPGLRRELWRLFHADRVHHYGTYPMDRWSTEAPRPVDVVLGACLAVRREVLDAIGPLDEDFYIYSEEVDLCARIRRRGWAIHWVPEARVVHHGGQSTRQVAEAMFLQLYRSKVLYFRKHEGPTAARAYKLILLAASAARLALGPVAGARNPSARAERRAVAAHYRRLIRALPRL